MNPEKTRRDCFFSTLTPGLVMLNPDITIQLFIKCQGRKNRYLANTEEGFQLYQHFRCFVCFDGWFYGNFLVYT